MSKQREGRGWLSSIDLLPEECNEAISVAGIELAKRERTQLEIYGDFKRMLQEVKLVCDVDFKIPSFSAFNRYVINLATTARRLEQTREIANTISGRFDAVTSDKLTLVAAETIKALIFEILQAKGEAGLVAKDVQSLANALRAVTSAQTTSNDRKKKEEEEFNAKASKAIDMAGKEAGLSKEAIDQLKHGFLGVRKRDKGTGEASA